MGIEREHIKSALVMWEGPVRPPGTMAKARAHGTGHMRVNRPNSPPQAYMGHVRYHH